MNLPKHAEKKPSQSMYESRRLARLVKATNHVAPYIGHSNLQESLRYFDALAVIAAYRQGKLMTLDRDRLVRLAEDRYGRDRNWRLPRGAR